MHYILDEKSFIHQCLTRDVHFTNVRADSLIDFNNKKGDKRGQHKISSQIVDQ